MIDIGNGWVLLEREESIAMALRDNRCIECGSSPDESGWSQRDELCQKCGMCKGTCCECEVAA